jgi:hypothetical protein
MIFWYGPPEGVWGIIDTGAARSLGGARWLENAAAELCDLDGYDDTQVDPSGRPSFTFGNGERKSACSTVTMNIVWGPGRRSTAFAVMDVHVPILLGRDVLACDDVFLCCGRKTVYSHRFGGHAYVCHLISDRHLAVNITD